MMRQQLREAVKRVFTGQLVEETGWIVHWQVAASSNYFQLLQVETSLYLWSWFPKKVESEEVAHLMKTDPKDLGISIKFPIEDSWGFSFWELIIQGEWIYSRQIQWRGIWKVFEGITAEIDLVIAF